MATQHIINRIAWLNRQIVEPEDVVGYEDTMSFTYHNVLEQKLAIEKEVKKLEKELEGR